jgi:RNA polymerase sigma-70 factor (ECF subfamily)
VSSNPTELLAMLDAHGAELHALLTRLTLRATVAEDLLQDLFLKLRNSPGFANASNRKAYMFQSAINLAFDWRRAQRLTTEPLVTDLAGPAESPMERMIDAEQMEHVIEAMQQLSELGRRVIVLHYLQQKDYAEIAPELGKTEHQVRGICHKALERLQTLLQPTAKRP